MDVAADVTKHCRERFGARVTAGAELAPVEHGFTHFRLAMQPQRVTVGAWPQRMESPGLVWLTRDDALAAALPAPIRRLIGSL
jgi:A/G-specific adenine glycosylase